MPTFLENFRPFSCEKTLVKKSKKSPRSPQLALITLPLNVNQRNNDLKKNLFFVRGVKKRGGGGGGVWPPCSPLPTPVAHAQYIILEGKAVC